MGAEGIIGGEQGTIGVLAPHVDDAAVDPMMRESVSALARPGTAFRLYQKVSRARALAFIGAVAEARRV